MSTRKKRQIAQRLVSAYMIVMLLGSGCSSRYGKVMKSSHDIVEISQAHSEFSALANKSDLPIMYVSEGKVGVSKVEAALEGAETGDLQARAKLNKQVADFGASRMEVEAKANKNLSQANALREKYSKEYSKAMAQISAREAELSALSERKDIIITSLTKDGDSTYNDIVDNGREKFDSETARIVQGKEIYNAIEVESNAKILEMTEASKATRERAAATVSELDAKAIAIQLETQARADELKEQIKSTEIGRASCRERVFVGV